jgi:hypothetical protein
MVDEGLWEVKIKNSVGIGPRLYRARILGTLLPTPYLGNRTYNCVLNQEDAIHPCIELALVFTNHSEVGAPMLVPGNETSTRKELSRRRTASTHQTRYPEVVPSGRDEGKGGNISLSCAEIGCPYPASPTNHYRTTSQSTTTSGLP